ncbi:MAG TPA: PcfJ domain-containing protein [Kaistia sp.]|nr:PcfJ domain-containing protein [Kaistia sp.]
MSKRTRERKRAAQRRHRAAEASLHRKVSIFASSSMKACAIALLRADPMASDYIEQAPVIVYGFARRHRWFVKELYQSAIISDFRSMIQTSRRLRDMMETLGFPWPMRKLDVHALWVPGLAGLDYLAKAPPSVLANALAMEPSRQASLVLALDTLRHPGMAFHVFDDSLFAGWIVGCLAGRIRENCRQDDLCREIFTVTDCLRRGQVHFDRHWTWAQALGAARRWHDELAGERQRSAAAATHAIADYGALPLALEVDGFEFVALRTELDLFTEGAAMQHCVASYWPDVKAGTSRIYGIRASGCRQATMELRQRRYVLTTSLGPWEITQIRAYNNERPPGDVFDAAAEALARMQPGTAPVVRRMQFRDEADAFLYVEGALQHLRVSVELDLEREAVNLMRGRNAFDGPAEVLRRLNGEVDYRDPG